MQLIAAVRDRFGPRAVITEPADVGPWLTDWRGKFHGEAAGILSPASTAEVAAMVALAAHHRVPL
ncbi:MAG TPA: hydroxyacid dehydrogenase, partial [Sphingomicrobium sp.]